MRRADRLFQIVQVLRGSSQPVTAEALAVELETSKRSVYRDIAALMSQRVPIRGEAGIGYVLDSGFDMPPLMLTSDEIEAAVLGAQWVASRGDPALARAARDLVAKIAASVPERLRPVVLEPSLTSGPNWTPPKIDSLDMAQVRVWIRSGRKLVLDYRDCQDRASLRTVWPFLIGYQEPCGYWSHGAKPARTSAPSAPTASSKRPSSTTAIPPARPSSDRAGRSRSTRNAGAIRRRVVHPRRRKAAEAVKG